VTDPHTGQAKQKKRLGGAYPGQRRPQHAPYAPPASDFGKDGTATAHFIAYGGGNALTLVKPDGSHQPQTGQARPEYIQGTLSATPRFLFFSSGRRSTTIVLLYGVE